MSQEVIATVVGKNVPGLKPTRTHTFKTWDEVANHISKQKGTLLKFSGCRDGRGYRCMIELMTRERFIYTADDEETSYTCYEVVSRKVDIHPRYEKGKKGIQQIDFEVAPYMTTNSIEKVQSYFDTKSKEFVKIKVLQK